MTRKEFSSLLRLADEDNKLMAKIAQRYQDDSDVKVWKFVHD